MIEQIAGMVGDMIDRTKDRIKGVTPEMVKQEIAKLIDDAQISDLAKDAYRKFAFDSIKTVTEDRQKAGLPFAEFPMSFLRQTKNLVRQMIVIEEENPMFKSN
jgi:hypothetical protein